MEDQNWNYILSPINNHYFNNKEKRDRFIGVIKKYDTDKFWDGFGEILVSLNENNFYEILSKIMNCVIPNSSRCLDTTYRSISEKNVLDVLELLKIEQTTARGLLAIITEWSGDNQANSAVYKRVHANKEYLKLRKEILKNFFDYIDNGLNGNEEEFLEAFFHDKKSFKLPARDFISILASADEQFIKELNFYHGINAKYKRKLQVVLQMYEEGVKCEVGGNAPFTFDVREIFTEFHQNLSLLDQEEFQKYFVSKYLETKYAHEMCPNLRNLELSSGEYFSFVDFYEETKIFFESNKHFRLVKNILDKKDLNGFPIYYKMKDYGLLEILLKYLEGIYKIDSEYAQNMIARIASKGDEFYIRFYDVLYQNYFVSNKTQLKSLRKIWDFIDVNDQNFVFGFIDKHYQTTVGSNEYLNFYTDIGNILTEKWDLLFADIYRDGSKSLIVPLADISTALAGTKVLADFKVFYSREHLLRVLELISDLTNINDAQSLLKETFKALSQTKFERIIFNPDSPIACLSDVVDNKRSVFDLTDELNPACYSEGRELIPTLSRGLRDLNREIRTYNPQIIYVENGIFSNEFVRDSFVLMKHLDNRLISKKERLGDYIFTSNRYYDGSVISPLGIYLDEVLNQTRSAKVDLFADRLIKNAVEVLNKRNSENFLNAIQVFTDKISKRDFSKPLAEIPDCKKQTHYYSSGLPCPKIDSFFNGTLKELVSYLNRKNEDKASPLQLLVKMIKADGGHIITTDGGKKFNARLTIQESIELILKLSNKRYKANNIKVPYYNSNGDVIKNQNLTVLERIEATIRDVDFRKNYLGVQYMNAVVYGDNYNEDVKDKKKQLDTCLKVPVVRCGKPMTKAERYQARNALETYDGLLDANNGRGLEKEFRYENYLKSLVASVVDSSSLEARKVRFIPLADRILDNHNGRLLGVISKNHGFIHLYHYLTSFGLDSYSKLDFLGDFDKLFLKKEDINRLTVTLEKFLVLVTKDQRKFNNFINFVAKDNGRYFEKSMLHLLKSSRLIAIDDGRYVTDNYYKSRYSNNNLDYLLNLLMGAYDSSEDMAVMLNSINWKNLAIALETVDEMSSSSNYKDRFSAYILVNEIVLQASNSIRIAEGIWGVSSSDVVKNFVNYSKTQNISALAQINKVLGFLVNERADVNSSLKNIIEILKEPKTIDLVDGLVRRIELSTGDNRRPGEVTYGLKAIVSKNLGLDTLFRKIWGDANNRIEDDINIILDQISLANP